MERARAINRIKAAMVGIADEKMKTVFIKGLSYPTDLTAEEEAALSTREDRSSSRVAKAIAAAGISEEEAWTLFKEVHCCRERLRAREERERVA